jgi:hypothetical protein
LDHGRGLRERERQVAELAGDERGVVVVCAADARLEVRQ